MAGMDFTTLTPEMILQREREEEEKLRRAKAGMSPKAAEILAGVRPQDMDTQSTFDDAKRREVETFLSTSPWDSAQAEISTNWNKKGKLGKVGSVLAEILGGVAGKKDISTRTYERKLKDYQAMAPQMRSALDQDERNEIARSRQTLAEQKRRDDLWKFMESQGLKRDQFDAQYDKIKAEIELVGAKTATERAIERQKRSEAAYMEKNNQKMGTTPASITEADAINADPENRLKGMIQGAFARGAGKAMAGGGGGTTTTTSTGRTRQVKAVDPVSGQITYFDRSVPDTTTVTRRGGAGSLGGMNPLTNPDAIAQLVQSLTGQRGAAPTSAVTPPFQASPSASPQPSRNSGYTPQGPSMEMLTGPRVQKTPSALSGATTRTPSGAPILDPKLAEAEEARRGALDKTRRLRRALSENYNNLGDFMGPVKNLPYLGAATDLYRSVRGKTTTETEFESAQAEKVWDTALEKSGKALSQTELTYARKMIPEKSDAPYTAVYKAVSREILLDVMMIKQRLGEAGKNIDTTKRLQRYAEILAKAIASGKKVDDAKFTFSAMFPDIPVQ